MAVPPPTPSLPAWRAAALRAAGMWAATRVLAAFGRYTSRPPSATATAAIATAVAEAATAPAVVAMAARRGPSPPAGRTRAAARRA